ncbi:MAG TPA: hypothetical protein DDY43_06435 [Synechococcales bacterium UBA10510]|nr:hypothetical protein [Synechococcales bacterium UBA10510]
MAAYSSQTALAFRAPHRITITLPHNAFCDLQQRCDDEGRSLSNLAAYLLETALKTLA